MSMQRLIFFAFVVFVSLTSPIMAGDQRYLRYASEFEVSLFAQVHEDTARQWKLQQDSAALAISRGLTIDKPTGRSFEGQVSVDGEQFFYRAAGGIIDYWQRSAKDEREAKRFDAYGFLLNLAHDKAASESFTAKNPIGGVIIVGILLGQGACMAGEAAAAAACGGSCQCGVQSYSRTCFAGFADVQCTCAPCPNWPLPLPGQIPISGFPPISVIGWQSNMFQVMNPPWLTP